MPIYEYTAFRNKTQLVQDRIEADNLQHARALLMKQGLVASKIKEYGLDESRKAAPKKARVGHMPALSLKDKIDFTTSLQMLSATGIPIIETLAFVENNADSNSVRKCAMELRKQIIGGSSFAETLSKHVNVFGRVYVGLVAAGEDSGEMDKTLFRMLELLKKQDAIKSKISGAMVYPGVILSFAFIVSCVLLGFVFPAFEEMFINLGKPLPLITQMCINAGKFIKNYWYVVILGTIAFIVAFMAIMKNTVTRSYVDMFLLKIPVINTMLKFSNFSNFLSVMQVAYDAGIPIVDCLYLANLTIEILVLRRSLDTASDMIRQVAQLSTALKKTGEVPNMIVFMIQTGEQSGRLGDLLTNAIYFIDKRLDDTIDKFTKLIEPFMMLVIGGLVMVMALALYLPLFGAYLD